MDSRATTVLQRFWFSCRLNERSNGKEDHKEKKETTEGEKKKDTKETVPSAQEV